MTEKDTINIENVKPLQDRVLIKRLEAEETSPGGIIMPDTAKEKPVQGKVLAVGPGTKEQPCTVKVHDRVLFGKWSGTEIKISGEEYLIMKESDIVAVVSA